MSVKGSLFIAVLGGLVAIALPACQNEASQTSLPPIVEACSETDVSPKCILETAEATFASIEDGFDWTTSAAELAIAYDSQGNSERAWALLQSATDRLEAIDDVKKRNTALADIALALPKLNRNSKGTALITQLQTMANAIESAGKQADVKGKILTALSVHGDIASARANALQMSQESEIEDAYKGRTLREIAAQFAKQGNLEDAVSTIGEIDSDFTYYSAIARTDVSATAIKMGHNDIAEMMFKGAEPIANAQENGYFTAGILRDIGYGLFNMADKDRAETFIEAAREGARNAKSTQEKARSMSRIATRLADCGQTQKAKQVLAEAQALAQQIDAGVMKDFSHYEIAGSAAFIGDFETAKSVIATLPNTPFGSATSLKSASERDLAWGLARHGQVDQGLAIANAITSKREKMHALSRLVRLAAYPKMNALPRYL